MKRIITIAVIVLVAVTKSGAASGLAELKANCAGEPPAVTAPAAPGPEERTGPFDVRKLFVIPAADAWQGPFVIQFRESADLAAVKNVLKLTGLETKELRNDGYGYYARIEMEYEYAGIKAMGLTDYTSVRYVAVNQKLWDIMTKH
ncbi:MAG: hypothetical protein NTY45_03870 [Elusimicrobia bacterium]|nr:hypothetical protein [Elusimicrobiota bacterium]